MYAGNIVNVFSDYLEDSKTLLYPTDTIWGLGCDATNPDAIQKIYNIKQRKESKALITLVSDKKMLKKLTDSVPDTDITSDPTTVIYQNIEGLSDNLLAEHILGTEIFFSRK